MASAGGSDVVTLSAVLSQAESVLGTGASAAPRVWPTGFSLLDNTLGGGLRAGELVLLGGPQGLGKTSFALQVLRHTVATGGQGLLFSFEHDPSVLLERFLALEIAEVPGHDGAPLRLVREAMELEDASRSLEQRLAMVPGGPEALASLSSYGSRLSLHRASSRTTTMEEIRSKVLALAAKGDPPLVVVDYLQKVSADDARDEEERVTRVAEALKDLALEAAVPVFAIVAADLSGIEAGKRLRVHHLRGSSALAYEPDIVLLLNDKYDVVARHHLVYDAGKAERFHDYVVMSVDKNRSGRDKVDLEFRKRFEQGRFERTGGVVAEKLVDPRVFVE